MKKTEKIENKQFLIDKFIELSKDIETESIGNHEVFAAFRNVRYLKRYEKFLDVIKIFHKTSYRETYGFKLKDLEFFIYPMSLSCGFKIIKKVTYKKDGDKFSAKCRYEIPNEEKILSALESYKDFVESPVKEQFDSLKEETGNFYDEFFHYRFKNESVSLSRKQKKIFSNEINNSDPFGDSFRGNIFGKDSEMVRSRILYDGGSERIYFTFYVLHYKGLFTILTKDEFDDVFIKIEENSDDLLRTELENFDPNYKKTQEKSEQAKVIREMIDKLEKEYAELIKS